ncbi:MAG: enoyl-CoA hydratase/isomerase family protein [Tepidisphaeraceae bacterium]
MSQPVIIIEKTGPVGVVTLNRPERRNALSIQLLKELCAAIESLNSSSSCRVIIIRGAGEGFCAGLDLKEASDASNQEESARSVANMLRTVHTSRLPTIAAVHGFAMAGGAGLMAACDLAVAASATKIGYPEVRRGLVPALVSTLLRHQVGERRLRELFLVAEPILAARAMEMGLINRVVPGGAKESLEEAMNLAAQIAQGAPEALASTKGLLALLRGTAIDEHLKTALEFHEAARGSTEAAEGIMAFLEKRPPKWTT